MKNFLIIFIIIVVLSGFGYYGYTQVHEYFLGSENPAFNISAIGNAPLGEKHACGPITISLPNSFSRLTSATDNKGILGPNGCSRASNGCICIKKTEEGKTIIAGFETQDLPPNTARDQKAERILLNVLAESVAKKVGAEVAQKEGFNPEKKFGLFQNQPAVMLTLPMGQQVTMQNLVFIRSSKLYVMDLSAPNTHLASLWKDMVQSYAAMKF